MITSDPQFLTAVAVTGGLMGSVCGLIPRKAARVVGRDGLGNAALVACLLAGGVCLGVGALPLALFLASLIRGLGSPEEAGQIAYSRLTEADFRRAGRQPPGKVGPYTVIGPAIVCNRCHQASSRTKTGDVPAECPHCGHGFVPAAAARPAEGGVIALQPPTPPAPVMRLRSAGP
jgi:hypothetical protein